MKQGMLYGVGVGPGDPELLTLKAVRALREADVIAMPDKGSGEQTARTIVGGYLEGKELLHCPTPMVRDRAALEESYETNARELCALLDEGKTVAFITLGDPCIYSTYIYIHQKVVERGYRAQLIPGVPSFCAAAARLGVSLCQGEERLLIAPAGCGVEDCVNFPANQVYMKAGRNLPRLQQTLAEHGKLEGAMGVTRCGMEGERLWPRAAEMDPESGYFSLLIVPGKDRD